MAAIPYLSEIAGTDGSEGGDLGGPELLLLGLLTLFLDFESGLEGDLLGLVNLVVQATMSNNRRIWATAWASSI